MDKNKKVRPGAMGQLPPNAYLANPYVPFQEENPPKYDARKGTVRGTLFPGLDLPFMGMVNQKELPITPKTELQVLLFAINELALYLDTHPKDTEALELYRQYQEMYHKGMMQYSENCSPLNHVTPVSHKGYSWINEPWPWEYAANK